MVLCSESADDINQYITAMKYEKERERKMRNKRIQRHAVFLVMLLMMAVVFCTACSAKQEVKNTEPSYANYDDSVETMPETEPPVQVDMPEYELTYSGALKDIIVMNIQDDESTLVFNVKISKGEAHIFTLRYNTDDGELVTVKEDKNGNRVPIAFEMASLPEDLNEEDQQVFFEAQDAVNEIVESLVLK